MHGWQANKQRTCAPPVILGLCPKMKYHPLCGWIFIGGERMKEIWFLIGFAVTLVSVLTAESVADKSKTKRKEAD